MCLFITTVKLLLIIYAKIRLLNYKWMLNAILKLLWISQMNNTNFNELFRFWDIYLAFHYLFRSTRNFQMLIAIENSQCDAGLFFLLFHTSAAAKWNQNVHFGNAYVGNHSEVGQNTSARTRLIEKVKSPIFAKSSRFIFSNARGPVSE